MQQEESLNKGNLFMKNFVKSEEKDFIVGTGLSGFTLGVTGREINHTDYALPGKEVRASDKALISRVTGLESKNIVMLDQVHGDRIIEMTDLPDRDLPSAGEADGFITNTKGLALVIRTADCVPVFIYDSRNQVVGAVHSGWKGTNLNITGRCIELMKNKYGSQGEDLKIFILPSIGPDMYEVNEDVARFFPGERIDRDGKIFVDLWANIEKSCRAEGVPQAGIYNPRICSRTSHDDFFSHRFGDAGRNLNYAFMADHKI